MNRCIKCGSYAFNLYKEGIDQGGLCDVHYWQGRAHRAEALAQPEQEPSFWLSTLDVETETPIVISYTDKTQGSIYADTCIYPVYTTPPQRKPLTEDEAVSAVSSVLPVTSTGGQTHHLQIQHKHALEITRAIEASHGIKENT